MDSDSEACAPSPSVCAIADQARAAQSASGGVGSSSRGSGGTLRYAPTGTTALRPKRLSRRNARFRVLVVDDEPLIRELVCHMLVPDFEVVTLSSGREALEHVRAGARFDVVLSDLMMPGVSGMDLFSALSREKPELARRMIFMTGGCFTDAMDRFVDVVGVDPLVKPFGREAVRARIAAQLSAPV